MIWRVRQSLGNNLLDHLLISRGISPEKRSAFLNPDYDLQTHDPYLLKDMPRAVDRILQALSGREGITIFADYDADGTNGAAILYQLFRRLGHKFTDVYIPDRYHEGYGLKMSHIDIFATKGTKVLITVDCGVTSLDEITRAQNLGIDVVVIDHHIVPPIWPPAFAILNPKHPEETYPYSYLCGAGLAFKLVDGVIRSGKTEIPNGWQKWLLDYVALATVGDMVPLTGENRILLSFGLHVLRLNRRPGLRALYARLKMDPQWLTAEDIGFRIGPRINAASRLRHGRLAFDLLVAEDQGVAEEHARTLDELNSERRILVENILKEAHSHISHRPHIPPMLLVGNTSWTPGVLGLVANRLLETYERPIFVWGSANGMIKGSCRSGGNIDVVEFMREKAADILDEFGGHAASGGFSLGEDRIEDLTRIIETHQPSRSGDVPLRTLDAELLIGDINPALYAEIQRLQPFGIENPEPIFLLRNLEPLGARKLGKKGGQHFMVTFRDRSGKTINAIGFFLLPEMVIRLQANTRLDIAASLECSRWRGRPEYRLRLIDVSESHSNILEYVGY